MPPAKQQKTALRIARAPRTAQDAPRPVQVHELEISLREIEPRVWRRFAVRNTTTLAKLHDVIQIVMGWYDCHLHQFVTRDEQRYAPRSPDMDLDWDADVIESRRVKLSDVLPKVGSRLVYEYDFGDGWEHDVKAVAIHAPEKGVKYPCCLAGERACPPEDCGGPYGYSEFLTALADPKHPEHEELAEWIGGKFDAEVFDLGKINGMLAEFR